jgi:hypothetical protein
MKSLLPFVFIFFLLVPLRLTGQTAAAIEADLLKSFKKIDQSSSDNFEANEIFAKKLKMYAEKFSFTINQNFNALKAAHLDISTSSDDLLRIYSWDTWTGGTMHFFENVFQYKAGNRTISNYKPADSVEEGHPTYYFSSLFTLKSKDKTYYLGVYNGIYSTKDAGQGIKVYAIENDRLNDNVKIIKTQSGLHNKIYYHYDFFSVVDWKVRPSIYFDPETGTIHIPVVEANGKVTHGYIIYKFTGQYFERVKN